ncbi:MAG: nucleotidyltransferase domain-containing protein [Candidatus Aenigmarchaeota archaeon]|nr:nucleotidyltransferase domain-containing protein [Candidatus Aenigmarchaeota archaeon]
MKKPDGSKKEQLFDKMTSEQKIASILYLYPDKDFTLSAMAAAAGVSKSRSSDIINEMKESEFIKLEKIGKKVWLIRANTENLDFIKWKIFHNLNAIYTNNVMEFLNQQYKNNKAIILFGSFRWGEDGKDSDIDIAVEVAEDIGYDVHNFPALKEIETALNRKIQIHVFNRKSVDLNMFNNIANGIVLSGFLEVNR